MLVAAAATAVVIVHDFVAASVVEIDNGKNKCQSYKQQGLSTTRLRECSGALACFDGAAGVNPRNLEAAQVFRLVVFDQS